jgi:hypothetical protein
MVPLKRVLAGDVLVVVGSSRFSVIVRMNVQTAPVFMVSAFTRTAS